MTKCGSCGKSIEQDSRFCRHCGVRLPYTKQDSVGAIIDDALDTTIRVGKAVAKEGYRVSKKVAKKVKREMDDL